MSLKQRVEMGDKFYKNKKYFKAIPYYSNIVFEKRSSRTEEIYFRLAICYFKTKKYEDAVFISQELLSIYPDFHKEADVLFMIGESYYKISLKAHYTQDETYLSLDAFKKLLALFPKYHRGKKVTDYINQLQHKLINKKYYNGYIYFKTYDYPSALLYFDEVIAFNTKDEIHRKSLYYSSLIHIDRKDIKEAEKVYLFLLKLFPASKETELIKRKLEKNG